MSTTLYNAWRNLPHWGVVFLDKNPSAIKSSGVLAYSTLEAAVASWRSGGEAYVRYGAPSATNPAFILVGVGQFTVPATVNADVNFLTISGLGSTASIFKWSGGNSMMFNVTVVNFSVQNLKMDGNNAAHEMFFFATGASAWNGRLENLVCVDSANYFCAFTGGSVVPVAGVFKNLTLTNKCGVIFNALDVTTVMEELVVTNPLDSCIYYGNTNASSGRILNCTLVSNNREALRFDGPCSTTVQNLIISGGTAGIRATSFTGILQNVHVTGVSSYGLQNPQAGSRILGCNIVAGGSSEAVSLNVSGVAISDCRLIGAGAGLAINAGSAINADITNSALRRPTGGNVGSSISSNITNTATNGGASNEELLPSVTQ